MAEARRCGLEVRPGGNGHLKVYTQDGDMVAIIPTSKRKTGEYPRHRDRTLIAIREAAVR